MKNGVRCLCVWACAGVWGVGALATELPQVTKKTEEAQTQVKPFVLSPQAILAMMRDFQTQMGLRQTQSPKMVQPTSDASRPSDVR